MSETSNVVRFIGDVHGHLNYYKEECENSPYPTIQVGDLGVGFFNDYVHNSLKEFMKSHNNRHKFFRGNHDDPDKAFTVPGFIKDGSIANDVFCCGGAWSIDQQYRIAGVSWWEDEELSLPELNKVIDDYEIAKPLVMALHDCPAIASYTMFTRQKGLQPIQTRTGTALSEMFNIHQPKIWVFGHWHTNCITTIGETTFICVAELETVDIDVSTGTIINGDEKKFTTI